jgi:hypothetical protein
MFFFELKNQKATVAGLLSRPSARFNRARINRFVERSRCSALNRVDTRVKPGHKVFCFCFSKKKAFLT